MKLLGGKTKCLFGYIVSNALYFYQDTSRSHRRNESLGITFTFTHSDLSRLFSDGFIREYADPDLSLTLHVTRHGDTGCLYLTAGDPFRVECLDAERTECKLVATLGLTLDRKSVV